MRAIVVAALLLAACLCPVRAATQKTDFEKVREQRLENDVKRYHSLVATYCAGNDDTPTEVLTYDEKRLSEIVGAIDSTIDPNRPWGDDFLRCGALLQTAVALKFVEDGADRQTLFYVQLAERQLGKASDALHPFASRWYYAMARLFRSRYQLDMAEQVLEWGRTYLPGNALILYDSGTLAEMRAMQWQSASAALRTVRSLTDTEPLDRISKDRRNRVQNAHDWLRQSVNTGPTELSRLHLGRVLMMRKEDEEALRVLNALRNETTDRAIAYLALIFGGALHERSRRLDDAARAYQQAIECFPEANTAYVALSEVLQSLQRPEQARSVLRDLLKTADNRREPWSWYFFEPVTVVRERMLALFQEGRR